MGLRQRRVKSRGSGEDDEGGASMPDHDDSEDAGTRRPLLEGDGERQGEGEGEGERGSGALLVREPVHWLLRLCSFFGSLLRSIFGVATGKVSPSITLTPRQEHAVYTVLGSAVCKTYDEADVSHVDRLRKLWRASLGSEEPFPSGAGGSIRSERWKDMGWQGVDPGTDIRGGGIMGLDNLIYLSQKYPGVYMKLMEKVRECISRSHELSTGDRHQERECMYVSARACIRCDDGRRPLPQRRRHGLRLLSWKFPP